jgi:hypothetical protein
MKCLRTGGVAVHTTEFNLSSDAETLEDPGCVIFRKRDMEQLRNELEADGYLVSPFSGDVDQPNGKETLTERTPTIDA